MSIQSLDQRFPIVDDEGKPTDYFMRLIRDRGKSQSDTDEDVAALAALIDAKADKTTILTAGAGLTGGGDLSANRSFAVGAGAGITVNADDVAIDTVAEAERIRDVIGAALVAGANVAITVNDAGDTITIAASSAAPAVQTVTSSATVTPTFSDNQVNITAQAAALALANPTGTAIPAWRVLIRIKDNGTARAISYDTQYRAVGITLPTTTVVSKTLYLGMVYNSADTRWDVIAVGQEV